MQELTRVAYVHRPLDEDYIAIAGSYRLTKEDCLPFRGGQVLYLIGHAAFDTACCGAGGCAYALVPGLVLDWMGSTDPEGHPVSQVAPIRDQLVQEMVGRLIQAREVVQQVLFQ